MATGGNGGTMIEAFHEMAKEEVYADIATSLNRIANALECLAFPYIAIKKDYEQHCKKETSWKKQAEYFKEAVNCKNDEIEKLKREVNNDR